MGDGTESAWALRVGWAIVHSVWEGAAICMVAGVVLRWLRTKAAPVRYAITAAALAAVEEVRLKAVPAGAPAATGSGARELMQRIGRLIGVEDPPPAPLALRARIGGMAAAIVCLAALVLSFAARPTESAEAAALNGGRQVTATPGATGRATTAGGNEAGQRILHCPADYSLGEIWIEDQGIEHRIQTTLSHIDGNEWEHFRRARGDVVIPAGQRVKLIVTGRIWDDPKRSADLERLGSEGLHTLVLSANWIPTGKENQSMDACMPHVSVLTGLQELDLRGTRISNEALKHLAKLNHLRILHAPGNLTQGGLNEIVKIKSLKGLHIATSSQLTDNSLALLRQLPELEQLTLFEGRFTDQALATVASLPRLNYLFLNGPFSNKAMSQLSKSASLKILRIHTPDFGDEGMRSLAQIRQLERLDVHWMERVTDRGVSAFANHQSLKLLDVYMCNLSNASLKTLGSIASLEHLQLPWRGLTDDGLRQLAGIKNLKSLQVGTSSMSPLTDRGMQAIAQLSTLEELLVGGKGITDEGMAQLARLDHLRDLHVAEAGITDGALRAVSGMKSLENLTFRTSAFSRQPERFFTVAGINQLNQRTDLKAIVLDGIRKGEGILNLSNLKGLRTLDLAMDGVQDKKTGTIAPSSYLEDDDIKGLGGLERLEFLQLQGAKIDDAGAAVIAGFKDLKTLTVTGPTQITDQGLAAIGANRFLTRVSIHRGNFGSAGLKAFENRDVLDVFELTSDHAFDPKAVKNFTQASTAHRVVLQP
jgi:internalin A